MKTETRVGIFIVIAIGIFIYLSINIRAIRLDMAHYDSYKTYFDDTGGLDSKALIRIAGVDVGWVEDIKLLGDGKAEINLRISKNIKLAKNAYAMISQEGLIGAKSLAIEPGDPSTGLLLPGSTLSIPGKSPATVSDLLDQFKDIASNIQDIAYSFKTVFATTRGEEDMKMALGGIAKASDRIADFSEVLNRTIQKNEENINLTLADIKDTAASLKTGVPTITKDIHDTFPSIKTGAERITVALADDTLPKVSTAFETIDSTAIHAREAFKEAEQVAEKINTGKGVLGKLINEDETYDDIKKTIRGLKDYIGRAQSLVIDVDMHSETLLARDWNSKGYFDIRIRPSQDYFYKFQLISDERGSIIREEEQREWIDKDGTKLNVADLNYNPGTIISDQGAAQKAHDQLEFSKTIDRTTRRKNDILFGLQFGKRFNRLALRIGMFESTFGFACDYYMPLDSKLFHWITSFEAFDFKGTKRIDDNKPYIRWINKIFFMKNVYTTFGFDDMLGKRTSGPFFGGGIRFGDDDLKYLLSSLPISSITSSK